MVASPLPANFFCCRKEGPSPPVALPFAAAPREDRRNRRVRPTLVALPASVFICFKFHSTAYATT